MPEDRFFSTFEIPSNPQLGNGSFVDSNNEAASLCNDTLAVYAQSQRTQQGGIANHYPTSGYSLRAIVDPGTSVPLFSHRCYAGATGWYLLKLWIYYETSSNDNVDLHLRFGRHTAVVEDIQTNSSEKWQEIRVRIDPESSVKLDASALVDVYVTADSSGSDRTVDLYSWAVYEMSSPAYSDYVDLSSSPMIGGNDYPFSASMARALASNIRALRNVRVPRTLIDQCANPGYIVVTSRDDYDADYRGLGQYMFRKAQGPTQLKGLIRSRYTGAAGAQVKLIGRLYPPYTLDYDGQTANFTAGAYIVGTTSNARAKILYDNDAGATGTLYLSHLEGTFQDNETIRGSSGGVAVVNGTIGTPTAAEYIDSTEGTLTTLNTAEWNTFSWTNNIIAGEAEYELRIDVKEHVAGAPLIFNLHNVFVYEDLEGASEVTHVLPQKLNMQIDDDVKARDWKWINQTHEQIWDRRRAICINDRRTTLAEVKGSTTIDNETGLLTRGVVFPSERAKYLVCRCRLDKPINRPTVVVVPFGGAAGYSTGETIYQQYHIFGSANFTNSASGKLIKEDAVNGYLYLKDVWGTFHNDNAVGIGVRRLYGASSTTARSCTGNSYNIDPSNIDVDIKFFIGRDTPANSYSNTWELEEEHVLTLDAPGNKHYLTFRLPIPKTHHAPPAAVELLANNASLRSIAEFNGPLIFGLIMRTQVSGSTIHVDTFAIKDWIVYEEPLTSIEDGNIFG